MTKEIKLNLDEIQNVIVNVKNGSMTRTELKEVLGGEKLDDIFDSNTIEAILDNIVSSEQIHTMIEHGSGLDILEGLLNNQIKGDLSNFYMIKSDYILQLTSEEQMNMAISISAGREDLAKTLQRVWSKDIRTEACTTKEEHNKPMIQFRIEANEFEQQDFIQQLYEMQDIQGDAFYDYENKSFVINLIGDNLYQYLQQDFSREVSEKKSIFSRTIEESLEFDEEMLESYSKNGIDTAEISKIILEKKEFLSKMEQREEQKGRIELNSEMLQNMQILGRGNHAIVYRYGETQAIKVLNEKGEKAYNREKFNQLTGLDSSTCVFPRGIVEIDGKVQGYIMDYVKGSKLEDAVECIDLEVLIDAIQRAEIDIRSLSQKKLEFVDLNEGSIMWDEKSKSIRIIDTDFYEFNPNIDAEQCYISNMKLFNEYLLIDLGMSQAQENPLLTLLNNNPQFKAVTKKYVMSVFRNEEFSIVDYIQSAKKVIEKEYGVSSRNLAEMRNLVGEPKKGIPNIADIPIFLPPEQQVETIALGRQAFKEISDIAYTDETLNEIQSEEIQLQQQEDLEQDNILK